MLIATDELGHRIEASNAIKGKQYYCPVCGNSVILRSGKLNISHFAHIANECTDKWNYDVSEWHIKMQSFFPAEYREIVVKHNSIIHRADILLENTAIEIQHSPISAEEFNDRNTFFNSLGYRIVWIFDVRDKKESGQIQYLNGDTTTKFKWTHPLRIFDTLKKPLSDYDKKFAVYFHLDNEESVDGTYISRVVWTINDGSIDFSRFAISEKDVDMESIENTNEFFMPTKEKLKEYALKRIKNLKNGLKEKGLKYTVKYIGERGKTREAYTCGKRNNKFGLEWSGEDACSYCRYCALTVKTQDKDTEKHKLAVYCCYPNIYREVEEMTYPGYDCSGVEELEY